MNVIQLDYAVPSPDLAAYVTLFYQFRADVPEFRDTERADHAQLRFRLSAGNAEYTFPDGSEQSAGVEHIVGPTSGAFHVRADGPLLVLGMGLTPAGWHAMMGNDASSMLNRTIDAAGLFGGARVRAVTRAMQASDMAGRIAIAEAFVRDLTAQGDSETLHFVRTVDAWLANDPSPDMAVLIAATQLSRRQIERKCNALYGAPPKLLARKYRALRAAVALASDAEDVDDLIARGFYDQSHLIREVKQFTGLTPRQIKAEPSVLAQLTISQRQALGGQVHPIISNT